MLFALYYSNPFISVYNFFTFPSPCQDLHLAPLKKVFSMCFSHLLSLEVYIFLF